jgi:glucose-6-phosphate 1-dehydrogenase
MKDFIILGASGDLTKKKLIPAIYQNYKNQNFTCRYIGFGRKEIQNYQQIVRESIDKRDRNFEEKFTYIQGQYDSKGFQNLKNLNLSEDRIFYLALPIHHDLLESILKGLKDNNLLNNTTTIAIEKPFGTDLKTAQRLIDLLNEYLDEEQIFLVDHYLAKDLVRNLISLRFANPIFSKIWNRENIQKIEIITKENTGIENRGEYYDKSGAIKDMIQNHVLQVLSLVTMETPKNINSSSLSKQKNAILKKIAISTDIKKSVELGQYIGYLEEEHIEKNSLTETYARLNIEVKNKEWRDVPITLETGKRLDEKRTEIKIYFNSDANCIWEDNCTLITSNVLTINLYPENNIVLSFNSAFNPSQEFPIKKDLIFSLNTNEKNLLPYANTLVDIYNHDRTYTPSYDEILLSWKFIDELLHKISPIRKDILKRY